MYTVQQKVIMVKSEKRDIGIDDKQHKNKKLNLAKWN